MGGLSENNVSKAFTTVLNIWYLLLEYFIQPKFFVSMNSIFNRLTSSKIIIKREYCLTIFMVISIGLCT